MSKAKGRTSVPIHLRVAVIARDYATCQYCGKDGVVINRYGKPTVVERKQKFKEPFDMLPSGQLYYNGDGVIPFEIDHIVPLIHGGENIINNLILSCRSCNRAKGGRNG